MIAIQDAELIQELPFIVFDLRQPAAGNGGIIKSFNNLYIRVV